MPFPVHAGFVYTITYNKFTNIKIDEKDVKLIFSRGKLVFEVSKLSADFYATIERKVMNRDPERFSVDAKLNRGGLSIRLDVKVGQLVIDNEVLPYPELQRSSTFTLNGRYLDIKFNGAASTTVWLANTFKPLLISGMSSYLNSPPFSKSTNELIQL